MWLGLLTVIDEPTFIGMVDGSTPTSEFVHSPDCGSQSVWLSEMGWWNSASNEIRISWLSPTQAGQATCRKCMYVYPETPARGGTPVSGKDGSDEGSIAVSDAAAVSGFLSLYPINPTSGPHARSISKLNICTPLNRGAGDGDRTHDIHVGNVTLYR